MKRTRFTDEQIVAMLGENEAGVTAKELCRKYGVSNGTFYKWKEKYCRMQDIDVERMKALEKENRQLRKLVAQQALDNQALKAVVEKKW